MPRLRQRPALRVKAAVGVKRRRCPFPGATFRGAILAPDMLTRGHFFRQQRSAMGEKMTKMRADFMMLAGVIAANPVVLYAQSDVPPSNVPPSDFLPSDVPRSDLTQTTASNFTIALDAKSGGVWRLNTNTGELWFCLASAAPQCHLAVDAKKKK
jgi:hypothetical protein